VAGVVPVAVERVANSELFAGYYWARMARRSQRERWWPLPTRMASRGSLGVGATCASRLSVTLFAWGRAEDHWRGLPSLASFLE